MKTELDKCMAGEWYDCHDPIFITQKGKTRQLLARYNALPYEEKKTKQEVLKEMFGSIGNNVSVGTPFLCDYGCNIHIGDNWKSHATLTLLATQDLPTFGYNMIDPLKSWCWGAILFYPFKNSRFS